MELTWYGHSCFLLKGDVSVLVDPFVPDGESPKDADIVAVTHGHADHLGETVALNKPTVAINEVAKYLASKGLDAVGMNIGGTIELGGVKFTMTQAIHSAWIEEGGIGFAGGGSAGFVIGMNEKRVYHAGDTALFSDMKLIGELWHPDVAILPIGDRFTMGPAEAMIAARYVGAPLVIPMHYNTWPAIEQDPSHFKHALERTTDHKVCVMNPGETIEI